MGGAEGCTDETVDGPVTEYACVERVADETVDEWDTEYVGIELVADETVDGRVTEYDCVERVAEGGTENDTRDTEFKPVHSLVGVRQQHS